MRELFFGTVWSSLSTACLLAALAIIVWTAVRRKHVRLWGRRVGLLFAVGLLLCIFVVMRDDYVAAVQGGVGTFRADAPQMYLAYAAAAVIGAAVLSAVFVRSQRYRKAMFFVLAGAIVCKAVLIEASRMIL